MMSKEKLSRINDLAKKSKAEGLSKEEKQEQAKLREEYLQNIRNSFTNQITTMTVIDPEGNDVTPEKVKKIKEKNKKHKQRKSLEREISCTHLLNNNQLIQSVHYLLMQLKKQSLVTQVYQWEQRQWLTLYLQNL